MCAHVHTRERVQNPWLRASRRTAGVARLWVPPGPPGRCAFLCRDSLQPEESGPAAGAAVGVQLLASTWGVRHVSHPPSRGLRTPGQCRRRLTQVALHEGLEEVGVLESVIAGPPGPCRSQRRVKSRWGPQGHHGVYRTASVSSAVSSAWWTPRGSCPSWGAWFKQATEQRSVRQATERACSGRCVPRC